MSESRPGRNPRVSDEEIIEVFQNAKTPVLTTSMAAEEVSIGKRALLNRLNDLEERNILNRMDVGARGQVWWLSDAYKAEQRPDYLKSFGKYADTDVGETVRAVGTELDEDFQERQEEFFDN